MSASFALNPSLLLEKSRLKERVQQQVEDLALTKELLRDGTLNRDQIKTALAIRYRLGGSLAQSLLICGAVTLDVLEDRLIQMRLAAD